MRWTSLRSRRTPKNARPANKPGILRPGLEALEDRLAPVVNAAASFPDSVPAGVGFDGVVTVFKAGGGGGTGTLLSTGRHVLTAAHVIDFDVDTTVPADGIADRGNGTVDAGTHTVQFNLPGKVVSISVPAANITVHNQWNGIFNQGSDIAIIDLGELAPFAAERREIYRDTQEVAQGKNFTFLGYGATNRTDAAGNVLSGNSGNSNTTPQQPTAFGTLRRGFNRADSVARSPSNSTNPFDDYVFFDLDNPSSPTDPGVTGEAISAPGDSGGPMLINGQIAGISSGGSLPTQFGGNAFYTRVSSFAGWIDDVVNRRYSLVLNMGNQLQGNNGSSDGLELRANNNFLEIRLNSQLVYSDLATRVRDVTLNGSNDGESFNIWTSIGNLKIDAGAGTDTVNIESLPRGISATIDGGSDHDRYWFSSILGDLNNIQSSVSVDGGTLLGDDEVWLNDVNATGTNRTYTVTETDVALPGRNATVSFVRVGEVRITANSGNGTTANVLGTPGGANTIIDGAGVVNVGGPSLNPLIGGVMTDRVRGSLRIRNQFVSTALTIDDSGGGARNVVLTPNSIAGFTSQPILFGSARLSSLTVRGGSAGNSFVVQDTWLLGGSSITLNTGTGADAVRIEQMNVPVTVNGQNGADTVHIGWDGYIRRIQAPLTVTNLGAWSAVTLDDSTDPVGRNVVLRSAGAYSEVTGLAPSAIRVRQRDLSAFAIAGGPGNNTFTIHDTPQSTIPGGATTTIGATAGADFFNVYGTTGPVTIDAGTGANLITVGSNAFGLARIAGVVRASGGGTSSFLVNDAVTAATPATPSYAYVVDADAVQRTDRAAIFYQAMANLSLFTSRATDFVTVRGTAPFADDSRGTFIGTGDGDDFVTVRGTGADLHVALGSGTGTVSAGDASHPLDAIRGAVNLSGAGFDVVISNQASTTSQSATVTRGESFGSPAETLVRQELRDGAYATLNTFNVSFTNSGRIQYLAGQAGDTMFVNGTRPNVGTELYGHPAALDVFAAGFGADTSRILGPVTFAGQAADHDFAYHYEFLNPNPQSYTVRSQPFFGTPIVALAVERPAVAPVYFIGLAGVNLYTPFVGGNSVNVRGVPAPTTLGVLAGDGDVVTVGSNAPGLGGSLADIQGAVSVVSYFYTPSGGVDAPLPSPGDVTLIVDDSGNADATPRRATLGVSSVPDIDFYEFVEGLAPAGIYWDLGRASSVVILGGAADETFALTGAEFATPISLNGGGGVNTLDYSALTTGVTVNLRTRTASGLVGGIAGIRNVIGGAGDDILVGNGGNVLEGRGGRDILIAGSVAASTLSGGEDDDLLIGGTTVYDTDPDGLDAIRAVWTSAADYGARVSDLRNGLLGGEGTVTANGWQNTLSGEGGRDFFFLSVDLNDVGGDEAFAGL